MYINNCSNNNVLRTNVTHDVDASLSHAMPIWGSINIFNTEFGNIYDKCISTTAVTITCCALLSHMMLMHHCHMPCRYGGSINIFNTEFDNIYDKYISTTAVTITCCALMSRMMLMHHCHMPCRYGEVLIYLILSSAIFMTNVYQQLL